MKGFNHDDDNHDNPDKNGECSRFPFATIATFSTFERRFPHNRIKT
jgi:hypothetical protein